MLGKWDSIIVNEDLKKKIEEAERKNHRTIIVKSIKYEAPKCCYCLFTPNGINQWIADLKEKTVEFKRKNHRTIMVKSIKFYEGPKMFVLVIHPKWD